VKNGGGTANADKEGVQMTQFEYYMRKTYLKTASLLEKCCSCAAILGNADRATINIAKTYGTHLGYAFQVCSSPRQRRERTG